MSFNANKIRNNMTKRSEKHKRFERLLWFFKKHYKIYYIKRKIKDMSKFGVHNTSFSFSIRHDLAEANFNYIHKYLSDRGFHTEVTNFPKCKQIFVDWK